MWFIKSIGCAPGYLLANAALDSFISYNMAIMTSLLLEEVDGCVMLVLLLTVSLS